MGSTVRNVFTAYSSKISPKNIPKVSVHEVQPVESVHFSVKTVHSKAVGASDSVGSLGTLAYILRNARLIVLANKQIREPL